MQHLLHARNLGSFFRRRARLMAGDQHVDVAAELVRGGDGIERRLLELRVVVLRENQDGHHSTFASLRSFSISALASATLTPALRLEGSTTFTVVNLGETSTPRASGLSASSVFFFAFMMFG